MDKLISLSAFGDVMPSKKGEDTLVVADAPVQKGLPAPVDIEEPNPDDIEIIEPNSEDPLIFKGGPAPKEPVAMKKNSRKSPEDKYGHIFKMVLQNLIQTKLLHWQSALYGQHKALDGLFEGLEDLGDTLAESIMGKYGKPVLSEENLGIKLYNFADPENGDLDEFIAGLEKCYTVDCRSLLDENKDSELLNIIDEITSLIDQTKYLISLR